MRIYNILGGIGKQIAFTALIPKLAEKEKIIVLSPYPDIYQDNPFVERSLPMGMPFVWTDYIQKEENEIFCPEPYHNSRFVHRKIHLIEAFCNELRIEYNDSMRPNIFLPPSFAKDSEKFMQENGEFIIVQFSGGQSPLQADLSKQFITAGQKKNYPEKSAQKLVDEIVKKYPKIKILNFNLPNEINLQNVLRISAPYLFYVSLLSKAKAFIGIDSSLNHMSAVTQAKGIVLWCGTSPINFSYSHNVNLFGECSQKNLHCNRPYVKDLGDLDASGKMWECQKPTCCDIKVETIMKNLSKLL
jgi:hypothetical protein